MRQLKAPWPQEFVNLRNDVQRFCYEYHPYTCGGNRCDAAHVKYAKENGDRDEGLLVATVGGWICPVCDYKQDWAWAPEDWP